METNNERIVDSGVFVIRSSLLYGRSHSRDDLAGHVVVGMIWAVIPKIILASFVLIVLIWDIVANCAGHPDATISRVLYDMSCNWPVVAFVFGFLCGHAFWKNQ